MSERTKKIREAMEDGTIVHRYPLIKALCDDHERLEAEHAAVIASHNEQSKLLDPAVVEAARSLKRNADKHPEGCCSKCREKFAYTERLEAQLVEVNGALTGAIRRHDETKAELARAWNEYALLVQESGTEGRELDRLEGLLRAWGTEAPDAETYHRREEAVYAEAVRLAKEKM